MVTARRVMRRLAPGLVCVVTACTNSQAPASSSRPGTSVSGAPVVAGGPVTPATNHPRLWITAADLPRLRSWATDSNPVYAQGLAVVASSLKEAMDSGRVPTSDSGTREYQDFPTEACAALFAFMSLISPDQAARDDYARRGRTLLMYVLNIAAKGPAEGQPFRDPTFATSDSNRARWQGESYGLAVDWLYPVLNAEDKATIRKVFLRWSQEIVTSAYHAPMPVGLLNDPKLLQDKLELRWAANNYETALGRNLGLMAMAMDPADDPRGELAKYLGEATGAFLYRTDALYRGDGRGGLGVEGYEYSPQALGYWAQLLLALHTAGQDDPVRWGRQVVLAANPFWSDAIPAFLNEQSAVTVANSDGNAVYQPAMYGDDQRYSTPDMIETFGPLGLYDAATGNTKQLAAVRWIEINMAPGGKDGLLGRGSGAGYPRDAMLYFLLLDPGAREVPNAHDGTPTSWFAPGLGRLDARTGWGSDATWFNWALGWNTIDHQQGDGNSFSLYRRGEWLTKPLTGYDLGTSDFKNTLAIQNGALAADHNDFPRNVVSQRGSQWPYNPAGDGKVLAESVGAGYVYGLGDATALYNDPYEGLNDVTHASRSILWLEPDVVVISDRASTSANGRFKRFWLSLPAAPVVTGRTATMTTPKGQHLFVSSLLPADASVSAAGVDLQTTDGEARADGEVITARLQIEAPGAPLSVRFLTVLQGADAGTPAATTSLVQSTSGTSYNGVALAAQRTVVLFPVDLGTGFSTVTYTVPDNLAPAAGGPRHLITGLTPGAGYDVEVAGTQVTIRPGSRLMADSGGVLVIGG